MAIFDDLIKSLLERNSISIEGAITISLEDGGIQMTGDLNSTVRDTKKSNKILATMFLPLKTRIGIREMVVPIRIPRE
jgi:hypothetical protein